MATRKETQAKREALRTHLREISRQAAGQARPAPTVRELAAQWNLSVNLVLEVQRSLVEEGVLRVSPRIGAYVGQPQNVENVFLFVFDSDVVNNLGELLPKPGFEDRMAQLGGAVLTLDVETVLNLQRRGELCPIAGVFDYTATRGESSVWLDGTLEPNLPRVRFGNASQSYPNTDFVSFEDEKGGWQATQHLLVRKHERIAFLAFHPEHHASSLSQWSVEREEGWKRALSENGLSAQGLAFHPQIEHLHYEIEAIAEAMKEPVAHLLTQEDISAVVTANDSIAECLLNGLHAAQTPTIAWPSIVSFDGGTNLDSHVLTSLRTPWDELGRAAADFLWARVHAMTPGPSQHCPIAMRLIPRLTCQTGRDYVAAHASISLATRTTLVGVGT